MQKIILDTNVLVSSLIQRSYPYHIIRTIFSDAGINVCISDALMREYYEVLNRKKFSRYPDFLIKAEETLINIERKATLFTPTKTINLINDIADNRLLELAEECGADFLITGNTNDFTMSNYGKTEIISPKDYYEKNCPH